MSQRLSHLCKKQQSGFTFIEVLFALVVLVFGAMGLLNLFSNAVYMNSQEGVSSIAVHLAQEQLEKAAADRARLGYSGIISTLYPSPQTISYDGFTFFRSVIVEEVNGTDLDTPQVGSGYKRVKVIVSTTTPYPQNVQLTTLFTNSL